MSKGKVNPRRKPASQADVKKAKEEAYHKAVNAVAAISMFVLRDKFGFGMKRLTRFWVELDSLSEDVANGVVKVEDIEDVLFDEYNINIRE